VAARAYLVPHPLYPFGASLPPPGGRERDSWSLSREMGEISLVVFRPPGRVPPRLFLPLRGILPLCCGRWGRYPWSCSAHCAERHPDCSSPSEGGAERQRSGGGPLHLWSHPVGAPRLVAEAFGASLMEGNRSAHPRTPTGGVCQMMARPGARADVDMAGHAGRQARTSNTGSGTRSLRVPLSRRR